MKINQVMKRNFPLSNKIYNKSTVRQRTKDSFFNATDLLKIYNKLTNSKKRINKFITYSHTKEFIQVIENNADTGLMSSTGALYKKAYTTNKKNGTWMHPYLFIDFAMWLSPEIKYKAIKWVHDNLIKYRVDSGDNYNILRRSIADRYYNMHDQKAPREIYIQIANEIKTCVGVENWNEASEKQLNLRNKIEIAGIMAMKSNYTKSERLKIFKLTKQLFILEHGKF